MRIQTSPVFFLSIQKFLQFVLVVHLYSIDDLTTPQWRNGCVLKSGKRKVKCSIPGCACQLNHSNFSMVSPEAHVNASQDPLKKAPTEGIPPRYHKRAIEPTNTTIVNLVFKQAILMKQTNYYAYFCALKYKLIKLITHDYYTRIITEIIKQFILSSGKKSESTFTFSFAHNIFFSVSLIFSYLLIKIFSYHFFRLQCFSIIFPKVFKKIIC